MNLIIGDSHVLSLQNYISKTNILHEFSASSIKGLMNNNSKTGTHTKIFKILNSKTKFDKLFIMFGKVDLEWIYYYKGLKNVDKFIVETVDKYISFIDEISHHFKNIYILGLHPPALEASTMLKCMRNYYALNDVGNKAFEKNINLPVQMDSLQQRTKNILKFNELLKMKTQNIYNYIDINHVLIDENTGVCNNIYTEPDDHHLSRNIVGYIWYIEHLKDLF